MPSLILTDGIEEFTWKITNLSNPFTTRYYLRAGITSAQFTVGGVSSISQIVDDISARSTGSSTSAGPRTVSRYPGQFTFWAWTQVLDGTYWPAGRATVTVEEDIPSNVRPSDWYWWSTISSGSPIKITATEWNSFCARINEFRSYVGFSLWDFTTAYQGMPIYADMMNEARMAIAPMEPTASLPPWCASGDMITARYFLQLRNYLNSVP